MAVGSMLWWMNEMGNQGENYVHCTAKIIKKMGDLKWLNSLPMFEYAFVLVTSTAIKFGSDPESYYNDLFVKRMLPILNAYHKRLMHYRIDRGLLEWGYESRKKLVETQNVVDESRKMETYTQQTRRALREAVEDYMAHVNDPTLPERDIEDTLPDAFPVTSND